MANYNFYILAVEELRINTFKKGPLKEKENDNFSMSLSVCWLRSIFCAENYKKKQV